MILTSSKKGVILTCIGLVLTMIILFLPLKTYSQGNTLISGPFSLSLRAGSQSDSATAAIDLRYDYLSPLYNLHLFGRYDWLNAGSGIGKIDNKVYGAGVALSHTYDNKINAYVGTSFKHEIDKTFAHVYLGGKYKYNNNLILSGSYGIGLGNTKNIDVTDSLTIKAEAVNWLKLGIVYVAESGVKGNLYYYLNDVGDENISGFDAELSYPVTENITLGIKGSTDITTKERIEKNWDAYLFVTYAFGANKAKPIDITLNKNNPIEYPKILRITEKTSSNNSTGLVITPASATVEGYSGDTVTLTVSGGTAPYTWQRTSGKGSLSVISESQAVYDENYDYCDESGTAIITVTDSTGASTTATITIIDVNNC